MVSRVDATISERAKLDLKDKRILSLLSDNGRMPVTQLAKKARLSRDSVDYKIQRLVEKGVILKFIPIVDLTRFGYSTFHVLMTVDTTNPQRNDRFVNFLIHHPHTRTVLEYSDRWDLEWVLVARNIQEFDAVVAKALREYDDIITDKSRLEVIKGFKSLHLPQKFYEETSYTPTSYSRFKDMVPDEKDLVILSELSKNARMSAYDIATAIKMSSDAVNYRIKNMTAAGVIRQFSFLPNLSLIGYNWHTLCFKAKTFGEKEESKLSAFIQDHPYIIRGVKVFGDWDIMLTVVADDLMHFHKTVKQVHQAFTDIMVDHQTWVAYKEYAYHVLPPVVLENERLRGSGP